MYGFVIFLAFLATTNTLSHSQQALKQTRLTTNHVAEPVYDHYRYEERNYNKNRNSNRDKSLDQDDDYDELSDDLLREYLLRKSLANAAKRGHLKATSNDGKESAYDARTNKYVKESLQELSRPSASSRRGLQDTRAVRLDGAPRVEDATAPSARLPLKTKYPSKSIDIDSNLRANNLDDRKLKKTVLSSEVDDEDTSDNGDDLNEPRLNEYADTVDTRNKIKNVNVNVNRNEGIKELPRSTISPKVIAPSRSKYDPPSSVQSGIRDVRDDDSDDRNDNHADVAVVKNKKKANNEHTREVFLQKVETGKTVDTDLMDSLDSEKNITTKTVDALSPAEDIEEARTSATREIPTTATPEINAAEGKSKKIHKMKYRERLHRKKDKRRPALQKNQQKPQVHSEQDDLPSPNKIYEAKTKSQLKLDSKIKDGESKGEEVTKKEDKTKTLDNDKNSDATNSGSPEVNNDGEKSKKSKVEEVDRKGSLVIGVEPNFKAIVNKSLDRLKKKIAVKEVATPSRDSEDVEEGKHDREHKTNDQEDKLVPKKMPKDSSVLGKLAMVHPVDKDREQNSNETSDRNVDQNGQSASSLLQPKARKNRFKYLQVEESDLTEDLKEGEADLLPLSEDSKSRKRDGDRNLSSNVNKNTNVNQISPELRLYKQEIDSEPQVFRRRFKFGLGFQSGKTSNRNRHVNWNGNKKRTRSSGVMKFEPIDDEDDYDEPQLSDIELNRRNLNPNVNKKKNHNVNKNENRNVNRNNVEASDEENNDRVYEVMANRRALERLIHDEMKSDRSRNVNRNVNKNVNRNIVRPSNPPLPRRVDRGEDVELSQKAVEGIVQEVSQLRKQLAEKEAESNGVSNLELRRALLHKAHNDMDYSE